MNSAFFFQTQQIPDDTILFDEFKKQNIFFSYFLVDQNYYLFFYAQEPIQIDFLYQSQSIHLIQELDSKHRKIRSLRGFFLYALKMALPLRKKLWFVEGKGKDYEILHTNLQPAHFVHLGFASEDFFRTVKNIIRQNKKAALHEFLFAKDEDKRHVTGGSNLSLEETIQNLQESYDVLRSQLNSLQNRIVELKNQTNHSKNALSDTLEPSEAMKLIQQGKFYSEGEYGLNFAWK